VAEGNKINGGPENRRGEIYNLKRIFFCGG
jgi:hypothetical protein